MANLKVSVDSTVTPYLSFTDHLAAVRAVTHMVLAECSVDYRKGITAECVIIAKILTMCPSAIAKLHELTP